MAYALNLDPRQNLQGLLPAPVLGNDSLSIRYYAASPGITYRVETSRDLGQWTTTGVTLSALDAENQRTASVPRDAAGRRQPCNEVQLPGGPQPGNLAGRLFASTRQRGVVRPCAGEEWIRQGRQTWFLLLVS